MSTDQIWVYGVSVVALALVPGIAVAAITSNTVKYGVNAGFNLAVGASLARASQILLVLAFLPIFSHLVTTYYDWIKTIGALYLIWMGYRVLTGHNNNPSHEKQTQSSLLQLLTGYGIAWSNPKALLFSVIIIPQFVDTTLNIPQQVITLGSIWVAVTFIVESSYILISYKLHAISESKRVLVEYTAGSLLVLIGFAIVLAGENLFY